MSNSLETSLTTIALSYFPWDIQQAHWRTDLRKSLFVAAVACAVRSTNAVIWVYLMATILWRLRSRTKDAILVILDTATIG